MMQIETISQGDNIDIPLDGSTHSLWMPVDASTAAADIDWTFNFILWVCTFFFVLLVGLGILFVIKYRKREGYVPKPAPHHSMALEITWSVIPVFLCVFMFWFGFRGYMEGRVMPEGANEVAVTAQKWSWNFNYENGVNSTEFHIPINEPTVVTMRSMDVIHSFFIPAFRTKLDVVPGRYSKLWFTPTKLGEFQLFCTEYCGTGHSYMGARVFVHTREDYEQWLEDANVFPLQGETLVQGGERIYKQRCVSCHLVDGKKLIGPPLNDTFGRTVEFTDGTNQVADENYIRESILDPASKIVLGYPNQMNSFQGLVKDEEIDGIIAYLKSLAK